MQRAIQELRNAELKRAESRTVADVKVEFIPPDPKPLSIGTSPLIASQFSIMVSTEWRFTGGDFDGNPVLPALAQYWNDVSGILAKAVTCALCQPARSRAEEGLSCPRRTGSDAPPELRLPPSHPLLDLVSRPPAARR